jgi:hypothetical protein
LDLFNNKLDFKVGYQLFIRQTRLVKNVKEAIMKKITYTLLVLLLMMMSEYSYSQRYEWMELYSSSSFTNQNQATEVFENNVYTVGEFRGSVSFGSTAKF